MFALLFSHAAVAQSQSNVVISVAVPQEDNGTYPDHEADYPAYLILKNLGGVSQNISGWSLTDNPNEPQKWIIPGTIGAAGGPIILAPGGTFFVFASAKNQTTAPYATNFLLPCGATAYLYSNSNNNLVFVSQKTADGRNCRPCTPLVTADSITMWTIPDASVPPAPAWTQPSFDDTKWPRGKACLGYDFDPLCDNFILYSTFDTPDVDTVSRIIFDSSGPFLHQGTWPAGGVVFVPEAAGQVNQRIRFLGNGTSFASYPTHAELDPGLNPYSFAIWVRPESSTAANEVIFRKGGASITSPGYLLLRNPSTTATFMVILAGGGSLSSTISNTLPVNVWTHLAVVLERSATVNQIVIYHNGLEKARTTIAANLSIAGIDQNLFLALGGQNTNSFLGAEDEFAIWGRALSAVEVARVFQTGLAGKGLKDPGAPGVSPPIYTPLINTDVKAMKGVSPGIYTRIGFSSPSPALVNKLTLTANYDDGFIAYLNGTEVARRNAANPDPPVAGSKALTDRADNLALTPEAIDISAYAGLLVSGAGNVLAIHAMNFQATDQRFLICPQLCYEEHRPEDCFCTTNDRDFWITFPGNAPDDSGNPLRLSLCITGPPGTTVAVAAPGLTPPFAQTVNIPAGGSLQINLPKTATLDKSDIIENKGVHITATANVAVYGRTRIDYSTDTFLCIPTACIGSDYLALGWKNVWAGLPDLNGSQFGVVATQDNTRLFITPKVATGAHPAGVTYSFNLNQGQTYLLRNTGNVPGDLTGSEIKSDKPVALFAGHRCAFINSTLKFFCDTVCEQMLPVPVWSTEYCTAPLKTRLGAGDTIRVLASQNATSVFINGVFQAAINRGDVFETTRTTGAAITASKPVLTAQYSNSSDFDGVINADPFQLDAQPTRSWLNGYKFCTPPATEFPGNYCNIIARNADIGGIVFNPVAVATGPIVAIGASGYSYRQITLAANTIYAATGNAFGLAIYGWDEYDSYGHSGGMGFDDFLPPTIANCPTDITLMATVNPQFPTPVAVMPDLAKQLGVTDNCCPVHTIVVTQDPAAGTFLQEGNYNAVLVASDCNRNTITCSIKVHVISDPRATAFPAAFGNPALEATVWGWDADPDKDGLTNNDEWSLGTNMAQPSALGSAFSFRRFMQGGQEMLEISYRKRTNDPSLDYNVEGSADLEGWLGGLGHFEEVSSVPDPLPGFNLVTIRSLDAPENRRFFIRLKLHRN